ncbi:MULTISPECIES: ScbR family autoregulator-binding transcription factor [unclassified Streptomyces]|uniref:ScbR family autoregulator-binding transcription factor n=1 Tax=unclassified Streptomyces TaxID=2593676 RepID=UPI00224E0568|nr:MULTISPECIES: ScbR family autoregulator-binding transcription factor [unclassified Streptomyces]MCX4526350.1 ScbR family autoregulator-binding transcription factor [Streptomyces sp. NBC_01551]MCX4543088.1 ScbR family autoregulator-binding transcription factor [Streptomyces sp. NBC_01565]
MARQERAVRTRRVILETAAEMFNELGYDATTIGGLIERIQLTRGGLYFHFTSKEQLARAVLDEAVTLVGVAPQTFKLQEWVDAALLLAYRLPREPVLSASIRLSVDPKARSLFGTRWPDWIVVGGELLNDAKERGELLPHVDPDETARLLVGAWTGVQLITETLPDRDLSEEISSLLALLLPNIACAGVLAKLDTSPYRAERLLAAAPSVS